MLMIKNFNYFIKNNFVNIIYNLKQAFPIKSKNELEKLFIKSKLHFVVKKNFQEMETEGTSDSEILRLRTNNDFLLKLLQKNVFRFNLKDLDSILSSNLKGNLFDVEGLVSEKLEYDLAAVNIKFKPFDSKYI